MDVFSDPVQYRNHFPVELTALGGIMKHTKCAVAVMLIVLSGLAIAQMNSDTRIVTQVPFQFTVANKVVPAGQYVLQTATMDGKTLSIHNASGKVNLFITSSRNESKQAASQCALVFEQYGDRYFLSGIKLQGSKIAYRLPESKVEAELRAQNVTATEDTVIASLQ
jgi:hypothetical protein